MVQRIVVKIGSSSLTDESGLLSPVRMKRITDSLISVHATKCQSILVTSGAVAAGIGRLGWRRSSISMPEKQAAAAVGQGLLIDSYQRLMSEAGISIAQLLLTRADLENRKRFVHIRNTMETLLRHAILPVVNENDTVAVDEIRFGDNDTLASLVALSVQADQLILLTDMEGLYTSNPRVYPSATLIEDVYEYSDELWNLAGGSGSNVGTGGMRTKLRAAQMAGESGISTVIANSSQPDILARILRGEKVGTRFHSQVSKKSDKRAWLRSRSRTDGTVVVDQGAVDALQNDSRSLLLPGILEVKGQFEEGAVVEIVTAYDQVIGRGATSFASDDLQLLLIRRKMGEVLSIPEVIHRNELVMLTDSQKGREGSGI